MALVLFITYSCNTVQSYRSETKHFHFEEFYNSSDSLLLADYIIYGISENQNFRLKIELNDDSLFNILKSSLSKQQLNINYEDENHNYSNLSFFSDEYLTLKKINKSILFKSASDYPDKKLIFPVLLKYYKHRTNFDASVTVYPRFYCQITLAVFVVQNCEVLYYKQVRHEEIVNKEYHPFEFEDFHIPISQQDWDDMIKEVMKEYIERLN